MSRTYKDSRNRTGKGHGRERRISVRVVRRDPPDLRKLSRALVQMAIEQAAAEAAAEAEDDESHTEQAEQPNA